VRGVLDTARRLASELLAGVEVRPRFRNVPPASVDETRLCQVFLNLLKNAAQALQGRPGACIELETEPAGDRVVVRISDNGPGIPPSMARRLFEPWQTTKAEGTGIGLALCRRYLAEMNGTIEQLGHPGEGARFEITLQAAATGRVSRPTLVPDLAPRGARILVVDDTPLVRRAIQRALAGQHHVEEADGAERALARLEAERFDVVLIDLHMPGRSGIDVYEEITERLPDRVKKVVFLSGAFGQEDLSYLEQRNLPWVRKPIGAEELKELVTELISGI
jgi:CheY-like chemotaxis protein